MTTDMAVFLTALRRYFLCARECAWAASLVAVSSFAVWMLRAIVGTPARTGGLLAAQNYGLNVPLLDFGGCVPDFLKPG